MRRSGEVEDPSGDLGPSGERLRRVFDHTPFGMVVCDVSGTILEVNDAFARMLGTDTEQLLGAVHDDLVVEDDPAQILEWTDSGEPDVVVTDVRYRHTDASLVWARSTIRMERDADGAIVARLVHVADLTNLRRAEDALATSEARFRRAFDESPIGMALCSTDSRLLWVNDALCTLLGRPWVEVVGRRVRDFAHRDDVDLGARLIEAVLGDHGRGEDEMRLVRPDGEVVWGQVTFTSLTSTEEEGHLILAHVIDITDAREAESRLEHQATHDALTGLPNRVLLLDRLGQALHRRERRGGEVVVIFLDLDDFKVVNDGLGHAIGDELLMEAARRLRDSVRPSDTVARLGGDEFVMVCELDRVHQVAALCDRIANVLARPVVLAGHTLAMSASIGVAIGEDAHSPDELLRDADLAMYRSKADGRGRSTLFTNSLRAEAVERLEQEADLRVALRENQLEVHVQPIVTSTDGTVRGVEALVRWRHPSRGLLLPAEFLPVAERANLITDVDRYVLDAVAAQLGEWQRAGLDLSISVNLAPRQLLDGSLAETVLDACLSHGAHPRGLVLEVTENALIEALAVAGSYLDPLREAGVRIALDDFGTGYSSLQYLRDLPVDLVKIDRSFVAGLGTSDDGALARAIVGLAEALSLRTVAEGVETQLQLEILREMGCDALQGFLLGRPAPPAELDLSPRW